MEKVLSHNPKREVPNVRRRQPTHGHGHGPRVVQLSQLVLLALPAVSSRCARALTALWLQPRLTLAVRRPCDACELSAALPGSALDPPSE